MNVILKEDFPALGFVGDSVSVRRGYARNFLLPKGIAIEANDSNQRLLKHELSAITSKRIKLRSEAQILADQLKTKQIEFTLKSGEKGKAFGSVTTKDIEAELAKLGFQIDRRRIKLSEPLRTTGSFAVDVRLHPEVNVAVALSIKLELVESEKESAVEDQGEKKKVRKPRKRKQENEEEKAE